MEAVAVIVVIVVIFAVLVALAVIATVRTVRAVKRGVDRTVHQARRTVEDTRLKARQFAQPGAAGEVAQLRLSLRTSMRATQDALQSAAPDDPSLSEALALFQRLSAHGHELDDELKRLETEPDKARIAARLPELRERTARVKDSADSLRFAAQDRARRFAEDDLETLSGQIRMEAGALRHWSDEGMGEAAGMSGAAGMGGASGAGAGGTAGAAGATGSAGAAGAPGAGAPAGEQPEPRAITGRDKDRDAWRSPGYSWQKAGRQEQESTG
ncbi:hypothetical protein IPZ58_20800 [Streptomyces roseoverticillatus]|uniref:hypothetical protein n=1 Tax=Streptomyces roseoverticillatus TaxID=66429 RepID=UPI001F2C9686|nr:hypothetical protein [Streptomyces roseoverticillatus]MCF3104012.1 hypothetical protein [Streptomyces roseoverticillatus]